MKQRLTQVTSKPQSRLQTQERLVTEKKVNENQNTGNQVTFNLQPEQRLPSIQEVDNDDDLERDID